MKSPVRRAGLLGLEPEDRSVFARLSGVLALTTAAEFLVEGVVTSAFLARVGAGSLPTALAIRAVAEALLSLAYERATLRTGPRRALLGALVLSVPLFAVSAASLGFAPGVWAAYVLASVVARIKTIHFGVLLLAELPAPRVGRLVPIVFAAGRFGAVLAGPIVAFAGPWIGPRPVILVAAAIFAVSATLIGARPGPASAPVAPPSLSEAEGPISRSPSVRPSPAPTHASASRRLLFAIVVGAVALALGRLALTTQSGAILEQSFSETELNRVLGIYFVVANAIAMLLQVSVVSRALGGDGLPWLNSGWSLLYLGAQSLLVFGPPSVVVALAARMIENELRNAVRTPVANLLYEAMPAERRASARTLVIGVTVPLASLVGGVVLSLLGTHPTLLAALGMGAALLLVGTSWAQNRAFRASFSR